MMEELHEILENSKLTLETIEDNLLHPYLQTKFQPREVFEEIKENTDRKACKRFC